MKPKSPKNKTFDWRLKDIPKAQLVYYQKTIL